MGIQSHQPQKLPIRLDYGLFARELADAQYELGLLQGLQRKLQNPSLLIAPLTAKEAAVSSKIEGTQSTASDIFLYEAGGEPRYPDTIEVASYRHAMTYAIEEIRKGRKFTTHFIKLLHEILLRVVRRRRGEAGEFRKGLVWIAERLGDPIEKATYIPPEAIVVPEYMDNLIDYIEKVEDKPLVQAGIAHYQFEAIHPFEDGNGRIGRLLIPLLLYYKQQLSLPIIYLSGYFETNRDQYINSLHEVDKSGRYEAWLSFFFKAVAEQSRETNKLIEKIYTLYDETRSRFQKLKSPYVIPLVDFLFKRPIFTLPMAITTTRSSRITCIRLIKLLQIEKVIFQLPGRYKRAKLFAFSPLLNILR